MNSFAKSVYTDDSVHFPYNALTFVPPEIKFWKKVYETNLTPWVCKKNAFFQTK